MHTDSPKRRLTKEARHEQLLDVARALIKEVGTDELTLAHIAVRAGVTKPLVYDHFGDRAGVLSELYRTFEERQRTVLDEALAQSANDLSTTAQLVAEAYLSCCVAEGRELADVVAALAGSPELAQLRREAEEAYLEKVQEALAPFTKRLDAAALQAVIGAGDALAREVLAERTSMQRAGATLTAITIAITN
ncbi:TetR/AcrR family transcriptional regulator [Humidisolicoccus flavus]|uniref:TetR/AcrR family transcriptional regulator n=1 Tax=Humidisolicoccus flavus TaxID=3111414 RepID=UPI0032472A71